MKNLDIDNDTSESVLAHPRPFFMASKRLQGEEQFHSKNYILEMPCSHAKMCLKSASQKLNFVLAKAISKRYTLDCSSKCLAHYRIVTHSNAASFSIKTILCETTNILFSKDY